jgi:hypothetical protein
VVVEAGLRRVNTSATHRGNASIEIHLLLLLGNSEHRARLLKQCGTASLGHKIEVGVEGLFQRATCKRTGAELAGRSLGDIGIVENTIDNRLSGTVALKAEWRLVRAIVKLHPAFLHHFVRSFLVNELDEAVDPILVWVVLATANANTVDRAALCTHRSEVALPHSGRKEAQVDRPGEELCLVCRRKRRGLLLMSGMVMLGSARTAATPALLLLLLRRTLLMKLGAGSVEQWTAIDFRLLHPGGAAVLLMLEERQNIVAGVANVLLDSKHYACL